MRLIAILLIIVFVLLGFFVLNNRFWLEEEKSCGGFTQHPYICKQGYTCKYANPMDAPGKCVKTR